MEMLYVHGKQHTGKLLDDAIPRYAVLSHTWGDEVTFEEMVEGLGRKLCFHRFNDNPYQKLS
jgi:hypothetical protein